MLRQACSKGVSLSMGGIDAICSQAVDLSSSSFLSVLIVVEAHEGGSSGRGVLGGGQGGGERIVPKEAEDLARGLVKLGAAGALIVNGAFCRLSRKGERCEFFLNSSRFRIFVFDVRLFIERT